MRKQLAIGILCLTALVISSGCDTFRKRVSGNSWSQTAAKEELEQEQGASPDSNWNGLP